VRTTATTATTVKAETYTKAYMEALRQMLREHAKELKDCVNELCYRCGDYKQEHNGACDGCRWKEVRCRDAGRDEDKRCNVPPSC